MIYTSLDSITRSVLLRKGYPMHYYLQVCKAASECLRELTYDSLKVVNTIVLPVDSNGECALPVDYVDFTKVGVRNGQSIRPLVMHPSINRLPNLNSSGNVIPYGNLTDSSSASNLATFGLYWTDPYSQNGAFYGLDSFSFTEGFKVIRERGIIQLDEGLGYSNIVLEYISDGQTSDNITKIHPYAQATIEAYCVWQLMEHNRSVSIGDKERLKDAYNKEHRKLRARLGGLNAELIQAIVRRNQKPTIKN